MPSCHHRLLVFLLLIAGLPFYSCLRDPNSRKQNYMNSGERYFAKGRYREAAIEFVNAIKLDPNFAEAHYQLAETCLRLQKTQEAAQELARTVDLQPENVQPRLELANLLILSHDFPEAHQQIDVLTRERPNDPVVHSTISSLFAAQGDFPGALKEVQKAIALDPSGWRWYLELAMLQLKTNQTDAAEESFKKVIALNPSASQARLVLGGYYQSENRYAEAEQQFEQAIAVDPKNPVLRGALVHLYLAEGKKSEAEQIAMQAKSDLPNDSAGYRMLGEFYFMTGDSPRAIAEYDSLAREHPGNIQVKKDHIQLLLQQGRIAEADKLDSELLKSAPNDNDELVFRSQIQISKGRANDAVNNLQTLIKSDPNNAEAHYVLGVGLEKTNDLVSAEREWREAVSLRPDLLDAWQSLAGLAMRKGDMESSSNAPRA